MMARISHENVMGLAVTFSLIFLMGVCLALGVDTPTVVVKNTIDEVIRLVTDETLKVPDQASHRRDLLEETIGNNFDFEEMAKRSLAVHWKNRNASEHHEFVTLFRSLLSKTYSGKIENYSGETINYLKERLKDGYAEVQTNIVTAHTENTLDYRLMLKGSTWRVYDVVVNGVSLVKNYRSQFARIIHRSSYEDLVIALREKSSEITAP